MCICAACVVLLVFMCMLANSLHFTLYLLIIGHFSNLQIYLKVRLYIIKILKSISCWESGLCVFGKIRLGLWIEHLINVTSHWVWVLACCWNARCGVGTNRATDNRHGRPTGKATRTPTPCSPTTQAGKGSSTPRTSIWTTIWSRRRPHHRLGPDVRLPSMGWCATSRWTEHPMHLLATVRTLSAITSVTAKSNIYGTQVLFWLYVFICDNNGLKVQFVDNLLTSLFSSVYVSLCVSMCVCREYFFASTT